MSDQSILDRMEDWGYNFFPKPHPDSPGYSGLLIAIREEPTEEHFDPEVVELRLCDESASSAVNRVKLTLASPFHDTQMVCPGRLIVWDRKDKQVEFFTFGAKLEAVSDTGERVYLFKSSAPILPITDSIETTFADQLASEAQGLISKYQAEWGTDEAGFVRCLNQSDSQQLYVACLAAILHQYEESPSLQESFTDFYRALQHEKAWLVEDNQWPSSPPSLTELLAPDSD
jgi:hypothetical protein